jgi:hypothetical protein
VERKQVIGWTVKVIGGGFIALLSLILLYFVAWSIMYRLPPTPDKFVDKSHRQSEDPRFLLFCSSLADNTFGGYPGHSYVVWSKEYPVTDFKKTESAGFVPRHLKDQIPSLFMKVPGLLVRDAWRGNFQNFTYLAVKVDEADFERTRQLRESWKDDDFQVGVRDCATFSNLLASTVGLKTPKPSYVYPQDYIRLLKEKN